MCAPFRKVATATAKGPSQAPSQRIFLTIKHTVEDDTVELAGEFIGLAVVQRLDDTTLAFLASNQLAAVLLRFLNVIAEVR